MRSPGGADFDPTSGDAGDSVTLDLGTDTISLPVVMGSEGEKSIDVPSNDSSCPQSLVFV